MNAPSALTITFLLDVLQANEGLVVALALLALPPIPLTAVALIMRRAGASLRPLVFIGGFIAAIAVCFLVAELTRARLPRPESKAGLAIVEGRFADRERLFSKDVPRNLIRDAKSGLPGILDAAEAAEAGVTMTGETTLAAQFPTAQMARNAASAYHRAFQLHDVSGDEPSGWRARRGLQGDFVEMLRTGRLLLVWSGPTREACAALRAAVDLSPLLPDGPDNVAQPLVPSLQPLAAAFEPPGVRIAAVFGTMLLASFFFFKGAAWAGSVSSAPVSRQASAEELADRLLSINQLDVPFTIAPGSSPREFVAGWRHSDAKWIDLASAHGLKSTFRIRLHLDESTRTVRATDYSARYDWSAGRNGADIEWKAAVGIVFFQAETQRVFGLQFDERGRFTGDASYTWRFNVCEMKSPLIDAVTKSGWTWRPTLWQGPRWLRWLTE